MAPQPTIWTIGHSTRSFEALVAALRGHGVEAVADVRLIPKSRKYPHFADESLAHDLPEHGIAYLPFKQLGGRRRPVVDRGVDRPDRVIARSDPPKDWSALPERADKH